jgi:hypothetical protein
MWAGMAVGITKEGRRATMGDATAGCKAVRKRAGGKARTTRDTTRQGRQEEEVDDDEGGGVAYGCSFFLPRALC